MAVRDIRPFTTKVAIIVNSDIAASQQVADRFCAMYSIPVANQKAFAMGTDREWAYSATRFDDFYLPLATHLDTIGASAVFCAAGCPISISAVDHTTEANIPGTSILSFPLMCSVVKRIRDLGYEPRVYSAGGTIKPTVKFPAGSWVPSNQYSISTKYGSPGVSTTDDPSKGATTHARYTDMIGLHTDADYEAAITTSGNTYSTYFRNFLYYTVSAPNYSTKDTLPCGWIGWWDGLESTARDANGTYSTNIWDRSRIILGKAGNASARIAQVKTRKVLVSIQGTQGDPTVSGGLIQSRWSLIVKKLVDLGFTNVDYWYVNVNTESSMYTSLAPISAGKQEVANGNWTTDTLSDIPTAGLTSGGTISYSYGFGFGFGNDCETTWADKMTAVTPHGLFVGGQSNNYKWAAKLQTTDLGHSAIIQPFTDTGGRHANEDTIATEADMVLSLLGGTSLAEAAYLGPEFYVFPIGDPLHRPFPT